MDAILSVRSMTRSFGGLRAVAGVSFEMARGELLGIIGPNGAGKSTLFGMIAGQVKPDQGQIFLNQRLITGLSTEAVARMGLVKTFQVSRPFGSMTFLENAMIGPIAQGAALSEARALARKALDSVSLLAVADKPASWASTGQRKRLEIARALAMKPSVLLLDEPFGGVDLPSIEGLIKTLSDLRQSGLSLLVIEHNLQAVQRLCDRLIAMNLGEILVSGAPADVTSDARLINAYMGTTRH